MCGGPVCILKATHFPPEHGTAAHLQMTQKAARFEHGPVQDFRRVPEYSATLAQLTQWYLRCQLQMGCSLKHLLVPHEWTLVEALRILEQVSDFIWRQLLSIEKQLFACYLVLLETDLLIIGLHIIMQIKLPTIKWLLPATWSHKVESAQYKNSAQ